MNDLKLKNRVSNNLLRKIRCVATVGTGLYIGLVVSYSCVNDEYGQIERPDEPVIRISLNMPVSEQHSRATDMSQLENKINSLDLFIFSSSADNATLIWAPTITPTTPLSSTGTLSLTVPSAYRSILNTASNYCVHAVANATWSGNRPAEGSNLLNFKGVLSPAVTVQPPTFMMMQGDTTFTSVQTFPRTLSVSLYRLMAKINIASLKMQIPGATTYGTPQVKLVNYMSQSCIVKDSPYQPSGTTGLLSTNYQNMEIDPNTPDSYRSVTPLYSFENDWRSATDRETYLLVNIPYDGITSNYYRIPLNFKVEAGNSTDTNDLNRLKRNYIYDVYIQINKKGSSDAQTEVTAIGNYTIKPWTEYSIPIAITNQQYVYVTPQNVSITNATSFTFNYQSDLSVSITGITAKYQKLGLLDFLFTEISMLLTDVGFPTITVNAANRTITLTSPIPTNYVPKNITFNVTNGQGLSSAISIKQTPPICITSTTSNGTVGPDKQIQLITINKNLLTIKSSAKLSYLIGDPADASGYTKTDTESNNLISPEFVVASDYGNYTSLNYSNARTRCKNYYEDKYPAGKWRLPTVAELKLINAVQDDPLSAVQSLISGLLSWWSAAQYQTYNFSTNLFTTGNSSTLANVRCVCDTYK